MKLNFEPNFQKKVLQISFSEEFVLTSPSQITEWRTLWTKELAKWHSPYKALIDCTNLNVTNSKEVLDSFGRMILYFQGFFLIKIVGFGFDATKGHELLPFVVEKNYEDAAKKVGLGPTEGRSRDSADFRQNIILLNDFRQRLVEIQFIEDVIIDSSEKLLTLRQKLTNNLMQWHSHWNLLLDCSKFKVADEIIKDFAITIKYFEGFFLKKTTGYSPQVGETYPFEVFRSRHKAIDSMNLQAQQSAQEANCSTRSS